MSLYTEMKQAGIQTDHHESDLYVIDCPEARAILENHGLKVDGWNVQPFMSPSKHTIGATAWLDIPFAYVPFYLIDGGKS